jgi:hypothetical protein
MARDVGPTACALNMSAAMTSGEKMRDPTHRS